MPASFHGATFHARGSDALAVEPGRENLLGAIGNMTTLRGDARETST
jgi:hypothetical protein